MGNKKQPSFAKGQKGTSGYLKPKNQTIKELEAILASDKNPIDQQAEQMEYEEEERRGITDHIRNIFD